MISSPSRGPRDDGLNREQALRCFARICPCPPLKRVKSNAAGAWMGCRRRWAVLRRLTIFGKAVSPRYDRTAFRMSSPLRQRYHPGRGAYADRSFMRRPTFGFGRCLEQPGDRWCGEDRQPRSGQTAQRCYPNGPTQEDCPSRAVPSYGPMGSRVRCLRISCPGASPGVGRAAR